MAIRAGEAKENLQLGMARKKARHWRRAEFQDKCRESFAAIASYIN
jgi:hypothetical protein